MIFSFYDSVLNIYPQLASFRSSYMTPSGLPHSKHNGLPRGVIKPQDGHILCFPKAGAAGLTIPSNFVNEPRMTAIRLRKRRPIELPALFLPNLGPTVVKDGCQGEPINNSLLESSATPIPSNSTLTG